MYTINFENLILFLPNIGNIAHKMRCNVKINIYRPGSKVFHPSLKSSARTKKVDELRPVGVLAFILGVLGSLQYSTHDRIIRKTCTLTDFHSSTIFSVARVANSAGGQKAKSQARFDHKRPNSVFLEGYRC